jgi:hypothetical protein
VRGPRKAKKKRPSRQKTPVVSHIRISESEGHRSPTKDNDKCPRAVADKNPYHGCATPVTTGYDLNAFVNGEYEKEEVIKDRWESRDNS